MAHSYMLFDGMIALEFLTSVVVQGRIAPLTGGRWGWWPIVVVRILLLLLLLLLLVELIVCKLLVLIVHVTPVVPRPLLPRNEVNRQPVRPDILHFANRFRRCRHLK